MLLLSVFTAFRINSSSLSAKATELSTAQNATLSDFEQKKLLLPQTPITVDTVYLISNISDKAMPIPMFRKVNNCLCDWSGCEKNDISVISWSIIMYRDLEDLSLRQPQNSSNEKAFYKKSVKESKVLLDDSIARAYSNHIAEQTFVPLDDYSNMNLKSYITNIDVSGKSETTGLDVDFRESSDYLNICTRDVRNLDSIVARDLNSYIYLMFESVKKYVSFDYLDEQGEPTSTSIKVEQGTLFDGNLTPTAPIAPHTTFVGWNKSLDNLKIDDNILVSAIYNHNTYSIIFLDYFYKPCKIFDYTYYDTVLNVNMPTIDYDTTNTEYIHRGWTLEKGSKVKINFLEFKATKDITLFPIFDSNYIPPSGNLPDPDPSDKPPTFNDGLNNFFVGISGFFNGVGDFFVGIWDSLFGYDNLWSWFIAQPPWLQIPLAIIVGFLMLSLLKLLIDLIKSIVSIFKR